MKSLFYTLIAVVMFCSAGNSTSAASPTVAQYRQYYSSWTYQPTRRYHYCKLYYKPTPSYSGYKHHYAIRYPRTYSPKPRYRRYVYFYNPQKRVYWGRFDLEGKPGQQYSLLKQADRKQKLEDIPEDAFPKPSQMPVIPESDDEIRIKALDPKQIPSEVPDDLP